MAARRPRRNRGQALRRRIGLLVWLALLGGGRSTVKGQVVGPLDRSQRSIAVDIVAGQRLLNTNSGGFSEFVSPSISIARPLSRRFEGSINLQPALLISQPTTQPPTNDREVVWAAALDVGLRWYPAPSGWKWTPFVEILGGVLGARHRVPALGTNFNFHAQDGVGVILPLGERWHPFVVARWYHISNGDLGHRNPSWDYWSIGVGGKLNFTP